MVNRLKSISGKIIMKLHKSFVEGRQILDLFMGNEFLVSRIKNHI